MFNNFHYEELFNEEQKKKNLLFLLYFSQIRNLNMLDVFSNLKIHILGNMFSSVHHQTN